MLHFLLIGIALFAAYQWRAPVDSAGRAIVITQGVVDDLVTQHVAARGREPSAAELTHLIEAYVHDEILYREGVRLGLDRDDLVVKRRVRQKIELIAEEDASTRGADRCGLCPRTWRRTGALRSAGRSSRSSRCFSDHPPRPGSGACGRGHR